MVQGGVGSAGKKKKNNPFAEVGNKAMNTGNPTKPGVVLNNAGKPLVKKGQQVQTTYSKNPLSATESLFGLLDGAVAAKMGGPVPESAKGLVVGPKAVQMMGGKYKGGGIQAVRVVDKKKKDKA